MLRTLRRPCRDRRADARGAARKGARGAHLQPGFCDGRIHLVGAGRSRPPPRCRRPTTSTSSPSRRRRSSGSACRRRSSCATARRTSRTSSPATAMPPATTATSGRRCSTPTPSPPSRRPATSSTRRPRKRLHDYVYSAGNLRDPAEAYAAFRGRLPTPDALLQEARARRGGVRGQGRACTLDPVNSSGLAVGLSECGGT